MPWCDDTQCGEEYPKGFPYVSPCISDDGWGSGG